MNKSYDNKHYNWLFSTIEFNSASDFFPELEDSQTKETWISFSTKIVFKYSLQCEILFLLDEIINEQAIMKTVYEGLIQVFQRMER